MKVIYFVVIIKVLTVMLNIQTIINGMESVLTLKKKIEINWKLCILCQKRKNVKKDDRLVEPTKHGLEVLEASFIKRMELANELGEKDERIERLTEIYQTS